MASPIIQVGRGRGGGSSGGGGGTDLTATILSQILRQKFADKAAEGRAAQQIAGEKRREAIAVEGEKRRTKAKVRMATLQRFVTASQFDRALGDITPEAAHAKAIELGLFDEIPGLSEDKNAQFSLFTAPISAEVTNNALDAEVARETKSEIKQFKMAKQKFAQNLAKASVQMQKWTQNNPRASLEESQIKANQFGDFKLGLDIKKILNQQQIGEGRQLEIRQGRINSLQGKIITVTDKFRKFMVGAGDRDTPANRIQAQSMAGNITLMSNMLNKALDKLDLPRQINPIGGSLDAQGQVMFLNQKGQSYQGGQGQPQPAPQPAPSTVESTPTTVNPNEAPAVAESSRSIGIQPQTDTIIRVTDAEAYATFKARPGFLSQIIATSGRDPQTVLLGIRAAAEQAGDTQTVIKMDQRLRAFAAANTGGP